MTMRRRPFLTGALAIGCGNEEMLDFGSLGIGGRAYQPAIAQERVLLVLIIGQSNAVGQRGIAERGLPTTDVAYWPRILGSDGTQFDADAVQPLNYVTGATTRSSSIEGQLGLDLKRLGKNRVVIVKVAQNSTNVASWLPGAGTGRWEAVQEEIAQAAAYATATWPGAEHDWCLVCVNGEAEATAAGPVTYNSNIVSLITAVRSETVDADAKLFLVRLHTSLNTGFPSSKTTVRGDQDSLPAAYGGSTIDIDSHDMLPDLLHLDGRTSARAGRATAEAIAGSSIPADSAQGYTAGSPITLLSGSGCTLRQFVIGDLGISGSDWQDQTGNGFHLIGAGGVAYSATGAPNSRGRWFYDGTDDTHACTNVALAFNPGTAAVFQFGVLRQRSWTATDTLVDAHSSANGYAIRQNGASPQLVLNMGSGAFTTVNNAAPIDRWVFWYSLTQNTTADYIVIGDAYATGVAGISGSRTGRRLGSASGATAFAHCEHAMYGIGNGVPSDAAISALRLFSREWYGDALCLR